MYLKKVLDRLAFTVLIGDYMIPVGRNEILSRFAGIRVVL